jgi:hypothetical protein
MRRRFGSNCHRSIVCSERNQISNQTELRGDWIFRCETFERTPSFPANISRLSCKSVICAGAGITLRAHSDPSPSDFLSFAVSSIVAFGRPRDKQTSVIPARCAATEGRRQHYRARTFKHNRTYFPSRQTTPVRKKRTRPIHLYYICSDGLMRSQ